MNRTVSLVNVVSSVVKELKLSNDVVCSIDWMQTVADISSYLNEDAENISDLSTNASLISCCVSKRLAALQNLISSLSNTVNDMSDSMMVHTLNSISLVKPESDTPICLCAWFYDSPDMETCLSVSRGGTPQDVVFDSSAASCSAFIEAFLANNVENTVDNSNEIKDGTILEDQGTQWMKPINGAFGEEYNCQPVNIRFADWTTSDSSLSSWAKGFNKSTRLYMKYVWYYLDDDGVMHTSDTQSMVLPSQTENHSPDGTQNIGSSTLQVVEVTYADASDYSFSRDAYSIKPLQISVLKEGVGTSNNYVNLVGYSAGTEYKIKFKANNTMVVGGNQSNSIQIYGDGALVDELNGNSVQATFSSGKTYLISILAGMVSILAEQ